MSADRSGLTLIEVLAALAILGISSAAWAGMVEQGIHTSRLAQLRDSETRAAVRVLDRASLWSRTELESRRGESAFMGHRVLVTQVQPALFQVTISDSSRGSPILRTSFFAPDSAVGRR